jgi:ribosomal protein L40E
MWLFIYNSTKHHEPTQLNKGGIMARKSLGFVPLIWECAFCNTQNPGPIKSCTGCGAPQPDDVEFLRVDEEEFNFIKDEALIRMAKAGPDIHCPFCGTRNPSTAELCSKCGGEIGMGGKARETGKAVRTVSEAHERKPAPITQPKKKRSKGCVILGAIGGLAILAGLIVLLVMLLKTDTVYGTVSGVSWERSIVIEAFMPVTKSDWWDEVPDDAEVISCEQEYRYTSEDPEPNSTEVCSEERVEDTGTGVGEVVQDCTYEVYDDFCEYTVMEWAEVETVTETGSDLDPYWPSISLTTDQREGDRSESYAITFDADGKDYTYTTSDLDLFIQAQPGTRWELEVNKLGGVKSIIPNN